MAVPVTVLLPLSCASPLCRPWLLFFALMFSAITYFIQGLRASAQPFFIYVMGVFLTLVGGWIFRTVARAAATPAAAAVAAMPVPVPSL